MVTALLILALLCLLVGIVSVFKFLIFVALAFVLAGALLGYSARR